MRKSLVVLLALILATLVLGSCTVDDPLAKKRKLLRDIIEENFTDYKIVNELKPIGDFDIRHKHYHFILERADGSLDTLPRLSHDTVFYQRHYIQSFVLDGRIDVGEKNMIFDNLVEQEIIGSLYDNSDSKKHLVNKSDLGTISDTCYLFSEPIFFSDKMLITVEEHKENRGMSATYLFIKLSGKWNLWDSRIDREWVK